MTSEVAPAASGRLSVANALSARMPRLIHHPLSVDCLASLTTGLHSGFAGICTATVNARDGNPAAR
jgi:hypothetical protein